MVPAWRLFLAFLRLGATAFGGPAMVAYMRDLAVRRNQWLSEESFADGVAICQSIPGATAMQTAAYVGLRAGGVVGAAATFGGFALPAFVLMLVLSAAYQATQHVGPVLSTFRGLQVIVVALVGNAAVSFGRSSLRNWRDVVLAAGAASFLIARGAPAVAIGAAAAIALVLYRGLDMPIGRRSAGPNGAAKLVAFAGGLASLAAGGLAALWLLRGDLFALALVMMKVDVLAFGGGFASVPVMMDEVVRNHGWMEGKTFMDGIALGQVTPGPIVITATFVGYQVAGVLGAVVGTAAVFTPSFLTVVLATAYLDRLLRFALFRRALRGVLASFVGLLLATAVRFGLTASWNATTILLAAAGFIALRLKVDILWVVLAGGLLSAALL